MANLSPNILILFAISAALAFFFPLVRDGVIKQLSLKPLLAVLVPIAIVLIPFAGLFGLAALLGLSVNVSVPCFFCAALLTFIVNRIGLSGQLRGVLLLVLSVIFTYCLPAEGMQTPVAAAILGLLVAKVADNTLFAEEQIYDDVVAPLSWLAGVLWLSQQATFQRDAAILLGIISCCLILKIFHRPFMKDDKWLVKRVVLAMSGGLGALIVITKLSLAVNMAPLAILVGAGIFATYLFQNIDAEGEEKISSSAAIQLLIVIGVLTLVATRFWGIYGLVALIPAAILPPRSPFAQYAGLFFVSRVLLQCFIVGFNSNVTGINVTHAYTGAALYAGFIVMAILFMLLRDLTDKRLRCAVFLAAGVLLPMAATFYLHAEATSSLFVSATVAGVMFATLGPALQRAGNLGYGNLLIVPSMMAVAGITYGGLIEAGVSANNETRLGILGGAVALVVIALLISWFGQKKKSNDKTAIGTSA